MTRIDGGLSTQLNPFGPDWSAGKVGEAPAVGQQVQQALFGRAKPPLLDPARFPELAAMMSQLYKVKKKLAAMAGDKDEDYLIALADGALAMIDEYGVIYVGAGFMAAHLDAPEVLVGALAHEIGHRPKRWNEYKTQRRLTREELLALCRHEETRADIFAGKALAELELDCQPLIDFLARIEDGPHPEYFPAAVRGEVIREAYEARRYRALARKKLFPELDRMTSPKGHLGEG